MNANEYMEATQKFQSACWEMMPVENKCTFRTLQIGDLRNQIAEKEKSLGITAPSCDFDTLYRNMRRYYYDFIPADKKLEFLNEDYAYYAEKLAMLNKESGDTNGYECKSSQQISYCGFQKEFQKVDVNQIWKNKEDIQALQDRIADLEVSNAKK